MDIICAAGEVYDTVSFRWDTDVLNPVKRICPKLQRLPFLSSRSPPSGDDSSQSVAGESPLGQPTGQPSPAQSSPDLSLYPK